MLAPSERVITPLERERDAVVRVGRYRGDGILEAAGILERRYRRQVRRKRARRNWQVDRSAAGCRVRIARLLLVERRERVLHADHVGDPVRIANPRPLLAQHQPHGREERGKERKEEQRRYKADTALVIVWFHAGSIAKKTPLRNTASIDRMCKKNPILHTPGSTARKSLIRPM